MRASPPGRLDALFTAMVTRGAAPDSPAWRELAGVVAAGARADEAASRLWPPDGTRPGWRRLAEELDRLALRDEETDRALTDWLRRYGEPPTPSPGPPASPPSPSANVIGGSSVLHGPSVQARDIHGGIHFHPPAGPARPGPPAPRQLPPLTPRFTDREADREALDALRARQPAHAPQVLVVTGLAGAGKTTLATHWLHEHAHRFPDGLLYADLGGHAADADHSPASPAAVLEAFLVALGVAAVPAGTAQRAALWRTVTAELRLAVLLDNAFTAAQVRPLLLGTPTGLTVVTSRNSLTGLRVDGASVHRLEGLPAESAVELLAVGGGTRVAREPDAAHEVVRLCGRLPLTVGLAAAQLAVRPHRSVSALAESLHRGRGAVDALRADGEAVMRTALDMSYSLLPGESAALYRRMGLLPTDRHDLHMLAAVVGDGGDGGGGDAVDSAVHTLVEMSLLQETGPETYRFHDLVRPHARALGEEREGPAARADALRRYVDWCLATADVAERLLTPSHPLPGHGDEGGGPVAPTPLAGPEEALTWLDTHRNGLLGAVRHCAEAGWDTSCWRLVDALWPLFLRLRPSEMWIEAHRLGLAAARRSGSGPGEGRMLTSGAIGLRDAGRYAEADDWYRQALDLAVADADVRQQAQAVSGLGHLALLTGRLDDARAHFEHALRLRESVGYRRGVALSRRRLAETAVAGGDLTTAARHLRRAGSELESLGEAYEAARVHALLGHVLVRDGDPDMTEEGVRLLRRGLESFRAGGTRSQHWEGRCLEWLGLAARAAGDTAEAARCFRAARDVVRRLDPLDARRLDALLDSGDARRTPGVPGTPGPTGPPGSTG
ncbi:hypothetical protein SUDANB145_03571 [Streptomyces sp. enrichment culture]|uniref:ATP-binding protein n=1 Tax=Streptomyces sp. enrichment culture TaxID=1795815 RepID=UPI003F55C370